MRTFYILPALAAGALMGCMAVFPGEAAEAALGALTIFARSVLPALLPFAVCVPLLTAGRRVSARLLCLLALPGGSPTGARLFAEAAMSPGAARRCAAMTGVRVRPASRALRAMADKVRRKVLFMKASGRS